MAGRKCRVLIVEDDADAREALHNMLKLLGHEVTAVGTAGEAMDALRAPRFDALILDLVLPDESGALVLAHIHREELPIKVAVVTALYQDDLLPSLKGPAPDAIFRKPVDAYALAGWVSTCVQPRSQL